MLLMKLILTGPLAPGAWTACVAACSPLAWNPLLFGLCWAACGPAGSLACFARDTMIETISGEQIPISEISRGNLVKSLDEDGNEKDTRVILNIKSVGKFEFLRIEINFKE